MNLGWPFAIGFLFMWLFSPMLGGAISYSALILWSGFWATYSISMFVQKEWKTEKKEEPRLPHEIFPELMYWELKDLVIDKWYSERQSGGVKGTYLGVLDGYIAVKWGDVEIKKYTPDHVKDRIVNNAGKQRWCEAEEKRILKGIQEDSYNEFLKALKEENQRLLNS
jgi:hypothetical protein